MPILRWIGTIAADPPQAAGRLVPVQGARLATLTLLAASAAQASDCDPELFRVGRSANTNVVVYLANLAQDGGLDARQPVSAEWILLAGDGGREPLTSMEEALAYGFDVRPAAPLDGFWVTLRAKLDRPIRVHLRDGCPRATAGIAGGESRLRLVFVETEPAFPFPRVRAVRMEGVDDLTGQPVSEPIPLR